MFVGFMNMRHVHSLPGFPSNWSMISAYECPRSHSMNGWEKRQSFGRISLRKAACSSTRIAARNAFFHELTSLHRGHKQLCDAIPKQTFPLCTYILLSHMNCGLSVSAVVVLSRVTRKKSGTATLGRTRGVAHRFRVMRIWECQKGVLQPHHVCVRPKQGVPLF